MRLDKVNEENAGHEGKMWSCGFTHYNFALCSEYRTRNLLNKIAAGTCSSARHLTMVVVIFI